MSFCVRIIVKLQSRERASMRFKESATSKREKLLLLFFFSTLCFTCFTVLNSFKSLEDQITSRRYFCLSQKSNSHIFYFFIFFFLFIQKINRFGVSQNTPGSLKKKNCISAKSLGVNSEKYTGNTFLF